MEIIQTDALGRLCIPDRIFHALKLKPGMKFHIKTQENAIILTKIETQENHQEDADVEHLMKLSEESLKEFLMNEPDLYTEDDLKVKYR